MEEDEETEGSTSIISDLAKAAQMKKKRKLMAYYCPFCNDPTSKLNENQLNLLEMDMAVTCKKCGVTIKKQHLNL